MASKMRREQSSLLFAVVASIVAWVVPIVGALLVPLEYLNTHAHEFGHAVTGVATGGSVSYIKVFADGSGVTPVAGGMMLFVASAGYVGAALLGALMITSSRKPQSARAMLRWLGILLAISMVFWVRGDLVGVISGIAWAGALLFIIPLLADATMLYVAAFLGLQQCLHAAKSLLDVLGYSVMSSGHSDASIMQQATGLPAIFWAAAWTVFSLILIGLSLKGAIRKNL